MLRRLFFGLVEGSVIGLALAVVVTRVLGLVAPGALVAALLGAGAGLIVGLVAGRPIWSHNAKTEALLKAFAGAIVGFGGSFAIRHFLRVPLDLSAFSLGTGPAGQLPAVLLPAVSTLLALFFELDDDGKREQPALANARPKQRIESSTSRDALDDLEDLDDEAARKREKR